MITRQSVKPAPFPLRQTCDLEELVDDLKHRRTREGVPHATIWIPPAKKEHVDLQRLTQHIFHGLQLTGEIYKTHDLRFVSSPSPDVKLISVPNGDQQLRSRLASLTEILLRARFPILTYTDEDPRRLTRKAAHNLQASFFRCSPAYAVLFATD